MGAPLMDWRLFWQIFCLMIILFIGVESWIKAWHNTEKKEDK